MKIYSILIAFIMISLFKLNLAMENTTELFKENSLSQALKKFGYHTLEERIAWLIILKETGAFTTLQLSLNANSSVFEKKKSFTELFNCSNIEDLQTDIYFTDIADAAHITDNIEFTSPEAAQAFIVAATQYLWFRQNFNEEKEGNPIALLERWIETEQTYDNHFIECLKTLNLISEVKRPSGFYPNIIIWLGALQRSAEPRIYGDIPDEYCGQIVVHSNQRGLIANNKVFEPYTVINIAQKLGLSDNHTALEIIEHTCKSYPIAYVLAIDQLQISTQKLRCLIIENLQEANLLNKDDVIDFEWPTEQELYRYMFKTAQTKLGTKLLNANLVFDNPELLSGNRIYNTTTLAIDWLNKRMKRNPKEFTGNSKPLLLGLSVQPFIAYQHECLKEALEDYYDIVTIGPESSKPMIKDALECLAKIIYMKAKDNPKVQEILPWLK